MAEPESHPLNPPVPLVEALPKPRGGDLPDMAEENRAFSRMAAVAALVIVILCAVYCYLSNPRTAGLERGELGRLFTAKAFYDSPPADLLDQQLILALGDSMTISGIDCRVLDKLGKPQGYVAYNLGVTSKGHAEFFLDLEQPLVREAAVVVTVASPAGSFSPREALIQSRRANVIRLLGYEVEGADWTAYDNSVPHSGVAYLQAPLFVHVCDSRWRVSSNLETLARLYWPGTPVGTKRALRYARDVYAKDIKGSDVPRTLSEEDIRVALDRRLKSDPELYVGGYSVPAASRVSYSLALGKLGKQTRRLVIVLAPLHPLYRQAIGEEGVLTFKQAIAQIVPARAEIVDCTDLLDAAEFRDDVHPSPAGAAKITESVATRLGLTPAIATP